MKHIATTLYRLACCAAGALLAAGACTQQLPNQDQQALGIDSLSFTILLPAPTKKGTTYAGAMAPAEEQEVASVQLFAFEQATGTSILLPYNYTTQLSAGKITISLSKDWVGSHLGKAIRFYAVANATQSLQEQLPSIASEQDFLKATTESCRQPEDGNYIPIATPLLMAGQVEVPKLMGVMRHTLTLEHRTARIDVVNEQGSKLKIEALFVSNAPLQGYVVQGQPAHLPHGSYSIAPSQLRQDSTVYLYPTSPGRTQLAALVALEGQGTPQVCRLSANMAIEANKHYRLVVNYLKATLEIEEYKDRDLHSEHSPQYLSFALDQLQGKDNVILAKGALQDAHQWIELDAAVPTPTITLGLHTTSRAGAEPIFKALTLEGIEAPIQLGGIAEAKVEPIPSYGQLYFPCSYTITLLEASAEGAITVIQLQDMAEPSRTVSLYCIRKDRQQPSRTAKAPLPAYLFEQGFLQYLSGQHGITGLTTSFTTLEGISELVIDNEAYSNIASLQGIGWFSGLAKLQLTVPLSLEEEQKVDFTQFKQLESIEIISNENKFQTIDLSQCAKLKTIYLSNAANSTKQDWTALSQLQTVSYSQTAPLDTLMLPARSGSLTKLVVMAAVEKVLQLGTFPALEELQLKYTGTGTRFELAPLGCGSTLTEVYLNGSTWEEVDLSTGTALTAIELKNMPNLKKVILPTGFDRRNLSTTDSGNGITPIDIITQ